MYLSRLILNPRGRRVQRELDAPYEMHRSLLRAFPANLADTGERILFRVDELPAFAAPAVLIQSHLLPDWSWMEEDSGARDYLLPVSVPNPAVKPVDLQLARGQTLTFRLRANPTVKKEDESGRPVRHGLLKEEQQQAWLNRKAEAGGFRILSANAAREGTVGGRIHDGDTTHNLTLLAVRFDGLLQVVDPERLIATVQQGIGSGKGLGFGLLSLARPPA
jgi:CRISPR system Cascade subunit CasE